MANESRMYRLQGVRVEQVIDSLKAYLTASKGMEIQSAPTTDGYVLQASQPKDAWKTISGMRLAITVHMTVINDMLNVTVGEGQWADKIGAGAIGWFIAWPLAVTAIVGTVRQKKLPEEIFGVIERTIYSGGVSVVVNGAGAPLEPLYAPAPTYAVPAYNQPAQMQAPAPAQAIPQAVPAAQAVPVEPDGVVCAHCGATVPENSMFCNSCGMKLSSACPNCGAQIIPGSKFCNMCGTKL